MKVRELEPGMLLVPAGDNEVFVRIPTYAWSAGFPYLIVKTNTRPKWKRSLGIDTPVLYLGQRKDLGIKVHPKGPAFSNRFVMVNGEVIVVDPNAWRRMKVMK